MRNSLIAVILFSIAVPVFAQRQPYSVVQRDANSRVWARTNYERGAAGQTITNVHRYTELATGMYYTNSAGEWLESKEQIDILPQGGASATEGQHKVYFPADIYDGVLEVVTPDGRHLKSRPLGLSYDDGSNCVWIGTLKHSAGVLISSNQMMYPDAFTGIRADILCKYKRGGFECDVVFREKPFSPAVYGLSSEISRLQLFTEFFNTQDPQQTPSMEDERYRLQDRTLKFGRLTMTHGKAFAVNPSGGASTKSKAPVFKTWTHYNNRTFLIEELPLNYIAPDLNTLPSVTNSLSSVTRASSKFASTRRMLPPLREPVVATNQIQIASLELNRQPGFVLDYVELDTDQSTFTFQQGQTYVISGPVTLGDGSEDGSSVVFQGGSTIKFTDAASTGIYFDQLDASYPPDANLPSVFTTKDDDSVGEIISGSTGSPTILTNVTFLANTGNAGNTPENISFYYAGIGLNTADPGYVNNCRFFKCYHAVQFPGWGGQVSVYNCLFSDCYTAVSYDFDPGTTDPVEYIIVQNVTADRGTWFLSDNLSTMSWDFSPDNFIYDFRNCLFTRYTNSIDSFTWVDPFYESCYTLTNASCFQSAGNANFYLSSSSAYRNVGTTDIDSGLLANLRTLTTYAPQDGGYADTDTPDIGYHYSVNEDSDYDGLPDNWEYYWFGSYGHTGSELDAVGNTLSSDYQNYASGTVTNDPNIIRFSIEVPNNYVTNSSATMGMDVIIGTAAYYSVLVDSTNFTGASWTSYTSSNLTASLGSTQGWHEIWVGLKGPAPGATVTWVWKRLKLDTTAPSIVITNPPSATVNMPMIQLNGYSLEDLDSISCDVSNVLGLVTNLDAGVTHRFHDTNTWEYTTNFFECLDVPLTNGVNVITIHATDLAGNVTTLATNITLDYTGKTAPAVQLTWPQDGMELCGTNFTIRGQVDDPTVSVLATVTYTNGDTDTLYGMVERNGRFWVDDVPLNSGTNQVSITFSNAASQTTVTNFNVTQSAMTLTMDAVSDPMQLWQPTISLSGTVSDPSVSIQVNGVAGTNNGDGTWSAGNVPVNEGGEAIFDLKAIPPGGGDPDLSVNMDKPARLYLDMYTEMDGGNTVSTGPGNFQYSADRASFYMWNDGVGGQGSLSDDENTSYTGYWRTDHGYAQFSSPSAAWPANAAGLSSSSIEISESTPSSSTNLYSEIWSPMLLGEHCVAKSPVDWSKVPSVLDPGSGASSPYDTLSGNYYRNADAVWKLETGGRGVPGSESVYQLSASLTEMLDPESEPSSGSFQPLTDYSYGNIISWTKSDGSLTRAISATSTTMDGKQLGADGNAWTVYAANSTHDITAKSKGKDRYTGAPPNAQKYKLSILANDYPLAADRVRPQAYYCVGQKLTFQAIFSPNLSGLDYTSPIWIYTADYVNNHWTDLNDCEEYNIAPIPAMSNPTVAWFYNKKTQDVTATLGLYCKFTNGQSVYLVRRGKFNVFTPSTTFNPASFTVNVRHANAGVLFGVGEDDGTGALIMVLGIDTISKFPGQVIATQLINRQYSIDGITIGGTGGTTELDNVQIYPRSQTSLSNVHNLGSDIYGTSAVDDQPGIPITAASWASGNDQFKTYFRFKPDGDADNIYVTLGRADWSWHGNVLYTGGTPYNPWSLSNWTISGAETSGPTFNPVNEFPLWVGVYSN